MDLIDEVPGFRFLLKSSENLSKDPQDIFEVDILVLTIRLEVDLAEKLLDQILV